ncbi:hypothetical protein CTI12_AA451070 [Artemisia annua]|uniref:Ubiquitin-like protease family profile domain-containing protein n=1 Tax=Artemisia annua TaxID=35608 RepID=A0A2U1LUI7_ARTAN|nr:hypothetical protein CTI12_AA451070 [Artemisia annua]
MIEDDDIPFTGTDENTEMADPMTETDQTAETRNDEPKSSSSASIKLTQQQLSAMILEFQGVYSQFKSAEIAEMEEMSYNLKANKSKFEENMNSLLFLSPVYQSIKDIDLMFFPMILADEHYYVVCFNLKEPQIHILDNMDHKESIKDIYQKKLVHLRYLFLKFLKQNGYPHIEALNNYKVANVKMPWQTNNNYVDCGIFAMRHMETYLGNKDFDAGFVKEGKEQKKHIEDLRKKYLTKILLSDQNENRHVVESDVEEYQRLTLKEKRMLQNTLVKNIAKRASEYFDKEASALLKKK